MTEVERLTERDYYLRQGGIYYGNVWDLLEQTMLPPSWDVFWFGLTQTRKELSKPSLIAMEYARMLAESQPLPEPDE